LILDLLTTSALAVSTFIGLACLWLAVSVGLLNWRPAGEAAEGGSSPLLALLALALLVLSALFFLAHSALLGRGVLRPGVGAEFWWRVAWAPVVLVPYLWYVLGAGYSGPAALRRHRLPLLALGSMTLALLLVTQLGGLPRYEQTLGYEELQAPIGRVQLIVWLYLPLLLLCALLPVDALLRGLHDAGPRGDARRRVRPVLVGASLLLLVVGALAGGAALWVWRGGRSAPLLPSITALMAIDLLVCCLIAAGVLAVGSAVVSYEVFTGGALPRRGFWQRWLGTVLVLMLSALLAALLARLELRPIYGLLSTSAVATAAYALLGWQNDRMRAAFMTRLRPFLAGVMPRQSPLAPSSEAWQPLFIALCSDVLATDRACLLRRSGARSEIALRYGWLQQPPDARAVLAALDGGAAPGPLRDGRAHGATWLLPVGGPHVEGALLFDGRGAPQMYSDEEVELARACCERLLDALAGAQLTAVAVGLLRQRIAEVKVLSARQRRALHDEVMPGIHAALIHLSARADDGSLRLAPAAADSVIAALSDAHRRLADLIRAIPPVSPHRLEQDGLAAALQTMIERDFGEAFDGVAWHADPEAVEWSRGLPPFVAEALFYAAQEAVRNAARHGRGSSPQRPLHVEVSLRWCEGLRLGVADDGVGLEAPSVAGSGTGLQFHEAMLAVVGASMRVETRSPAGTLVTISLGEDTSPR
jgi:signal transduction histidine kinase